MTSSSPAQPSKTDLTPSVIKADIFSALVALVVSVGVTLLWRALHWPGQLFASPLAFFLAMGSFFAWRSPRLRSRSWTMKVGYTLLFGVPGLLVGWLSIALLH
ncbi:MAG: hypothetical protein ABSH28_12345 [Acidobacteriota bacterium]|jgi:hypothetical protein